VETRANFRSALDTNTTNNNYNNAASATNITDYPAWKSGTQNVVAKMNKKQHATTTTNFFSAANLKN